MAESTKGKILKAAVYMFSGYNYYTTSMAMIAEKAGVSKGTLYWHFASKEELFRELLIKAGTYFIKVFKTSAQKSNISAVDKLYEIIRLTVEMSEEKYGIKSILSKNAQFISGESKQKLLKKREEIIEVLSSIVKQGIKEKTIRDGDPHQLATAILAVIFNPHGSWLIDELRDNEEQVNFIFGFIMNGISTKGEVK